MTFSTLYPLGQQLRKCCLLTTHIKPFIWTEFMYLLQGTLYYVKDAVQLWQFSTWPYRRIWPLSFNYWLLLVITCCKYCGVKERGVVMGQAESEDGKNRVFHFHKQSVLQKQICLGLVPTTDLLNWEHKHSTAPPSIRQTSCF